MVRLVIELDDEVYARLAAEAEAAALSAEALLTRMATERTSASDISPEVRAIIEEQLVTYRDVFHRLAQ